MRILLYLLIPALVVAAFATVTWLRNRQPTSLESGVDAFRREMDALSPDVVPQRGKDSVKPAARRPPPRRPGDGSGA